MRHLLALVEAVRSRPGPLVLSLLGALVLAAALALAGVLSGSAATRAAAQSSSEDTTPTPQTDASVPAFNVTMIGATPEEPGAPPGAGETWGVGTENGTQETAIVRYTRDGGWTLGPSLQDQAGKTLSGFELDKSTLAGQMTRQGAGVLLGEVKGTAAHQALLVRKQGEPFKETARVPAQGETLEAGEEPLLDSEEALFSSSRAP